MAILERAGGRVAPAGEDARGALAANAEAALLAAGEAGLPWGGGRAAAAGRAAMLPAALYLFLLALTLLAGAAGGVGAVLARTGAEGTRELLGFGWLAAYGALSGSPVAAVAVSLLSGGAVDAAGALGMLTGSRMGASLVVLLAGFAGYLRGQRRPDGLYVGVVALLVTFTVYAPALPLALAASRAGWLDGAASALPAGWADVPAGLAAPVAGPAVERLPGAVVLAAGVAALLGAFALFDRLLPNLDPPSARIERLARRPGSRWAMFALGGVVTALTLSVALSVTVLVPLALKGLIRRESVVPYVMGANVTTLLDTLFAAALLDVAVAAPVVMAELGAVSVVSLAWLLAYGPYSRVVLGVAHAVTSDRRWLAGFLLALAVMPVALVMG